MSHVELQSLKKFLLKTQVLEPLKPVLDVCKTQKHSFYLVGGALRNFFLGHMPTDFDFCTSMPVENLLQYFLNADPSGKLWGSFSFQARGLSYNITTLRQEGPYSDACHPDWIRPTTQVQKDSERRDFTVNALYWDCLREEFWDFHQGFEHLKAGKLVMISIPSQRLKENPLRILRALRFASTLGLKLSSDLKAACSELMLDVKKVPCSQVFKELNFLLEGYFLKQQWSDLAELRLWPAVFKEAQPNPPWLKTKEDGRSLSWGLLLKLLYVSFPSAYLEQQFLSLNPPKKVFQRAQKFWVFEERAKHLKVKTAGSKEALFHFLKAYEVLEPFERKEGLIFLKWVMQGSRDKEEKFTQIQAELKKCPLQAPLIDAAFLLEKGVPSQKLSRALMTLHAQQIYHEIVSAGELWDRFHDLV